MTITCNLYINGQWHDAEGRRTFTRRHPAHDEAASVAATASLADGKRCVEAAACAFPLWRDTAPAERRRLLLEAAEQMLLRRRNLSPPWPRRPARPRTGPDLTFIWRQIFCVKRRR